jgi:hypothetical protein
MAVGNVFALNLAWTTPRPKRLDIVKLMSILPDPLCVEDMFYGASAMQTGNGSYQLSGMILYGLLHYVTCWRDRATGYWTMFDDSNTRPIDQSGTIHDLVIY